MKVQYCNITIESQLPIKSVLSFAFKVAANHHAKALLKVIAGDGCQVELKKKVTKGETITISDTGDGSIVYSGLVEKAAIFTLSGYTQADITLSSGSVLLDEERKSRSFQDAGMTYGQVVDKVLDGYTGSGVIFSKYKNTPIGGPIIQYQETDWEFLMRLASQLGMRLIPETGKAAPRFYFGIKKGKKSENLVEEEYETGLSSRYYELGGSQLGIDKKKFVYYNIISIQNRQLGDNVTFHGRNLKICEKKGGLEGGQMIYQYQLAEEESLQEKIRYNTRIAGMTLHGTVLSSEKETVKLHLEIDQKQDKATAYSYEWVPESGSTMYCMPQNDTQVSLYMGSADEKQAKVVNCVRTNGATAEGMSDFSQRGLATEYGKNLNLHADSVGVSAGGQNMSLDDGKGTALESELALSITAKQAIQVQSDTGIRVEVPTQVCISSAQMGACALELNNEFQLYAPLSVLRGTSYSTYPPVEAALEVKEVERDWAQLIGNFALGVGIAALLVVGSVMTGGLVAAAFMGAAVGVITATVEMTVSDYANNTSTSFLDALGKMAIGAAVGAITGTMGEALQAAKFFKAAGKLGKILLMGGEGSLETLIDNALHGKGTTLGEALFTFAISALTFGALDGLSNKLKKSNIEDVEYGKHFKKGKNNRKELKANVRYIDKNGYTYETDQLGRIKKASTKKLVLKKGKRNGYAQKVAGREDRLIVDQGGHLFGTQFNGSGGLDNLVAQNASLNGSGGKWYKMEQEWAEALKSNPPSTVKVNIKICYRKSSKRPFRFVVNYQIDGVKYRKKFINYKK